eukprot:2241008-Rhodomonas_salina.1
MAALAARDPSTLSAEELKLLKKQKRLVRNRQSAQLSRQRKKSHMETLEIQVLCPALISSRASQALDDITIADTRARSRARATGAGSARGPPHTREPIPSQTTGSAGAPAFLAAAAASDAGSRAARARSDGDGGADAGRDAVLADRPDGPAAGASADGSLAAVRRRELAAA